MVRGVKDYPKEGILFRDITPLLDDGAAFSTVVDELAVLIPLGADVVAGIEARGFIFGAALAHKLGIGFAPIRKAGKLPYPALKVEYELEYGTAAIEAHVDAFSRNKNVVIVDDLLATGGTASAAKELVEKLGGRVLAHAFIIELLGLKGRDRLGGCNVISLAKY